MFATWKTWIWLVLAAIAVIILAGAAANGADVANPYLVTSEPANGARNISVYQWINVTFNENVCESNDPLNIAWHPRRIAGCGTPGAVNLILRRPVLMARA
jgi:hypothetical protein